MGGALVAAMITQLSLHTLFTVLGLRIQLDENRAGIRIAHG